MMAYKGTRKPLAEIAGDLSAAFLVESSVRTEGARVRITSRLIRASDQIQIWSESYDGEPSSVIGFQRELSVAIAQEVKLRLSPGRLNGLARRQTRNGEAYDLYLRGRYFWNQLSPQTTRRAVEFYIRATELDPDYALAWSGLADAFAAGPINGDACPLQMGPRARAAANRAVGAAPDLAQVQASTGLIRFWLDWDWPAAETAFRTAIALDPSYSLAHRTLGIILSSMKRHQEALSAVRRARELDPLDYVHRALSAQIAFDSGDYSSAVEFARQANVLDPEFWMGYYQLAQACQELGESDLALDALQKAGLFGGGNSKVLSLRGYILAKQGRYGEAREVLKTLEAVSRDRYLPPYASALVHAGLGERDAALEWLNRAYDVHDVHLVLLTMDPKWETFRSDDRFLAVINRCGFTAGSPRDTA
jgi:tetratricopeptide (TPR) repeat protein